MSDEARYPGYDVLEKRDGMSWNHATRRTLDARLSLPFGPRFFTQSEWLTLSALCERILPQPRGRDAVPIPAMLDERLLSGRTDGFRRTRLPQQDEAWRRGLAALTSEARARYGAPFHDIDIEEQNELLRRLQAGELSGEPGATCRVRSFSSIAFSSISPPPITPIPCPGTRSASAVRQAPRLCAHGFRSTRSVGGGGGEAGAGRAKALAENERVR